MKLKSPTLILVAIAVWIVSLFAAVRLLGKNLPFKDIAVNGSRRHAFVRVAFKTVIVKTQKIKRLAVLR